MTVPIKGIIPVMLTPFDDDGGIDWPGYTTLVEWYLAHGADALFAVCQSSEMFHLSLAERVQLARCTVDLVNGRVPVVACGHISDDLDDQLAELRAIAETGVDGLILVTNRLAGQQEPDAGTVKASLEHILSGLPGDLQLGLYECPAPYRRLLTDDDIRFCADSGRFVLLKDVSCDLETVTRRVRLAEGSPLAIINANAAIAWPAMRAGSVGFCGVLNNFHPDLYHWLLAARHEPSALADELSVFLALSATCESLGYPAIAKLFHQRLGTFKSIRCRANDDDIRARVWAVDAILEKIVEGSEIYRRKIAGHGSSMSNRVALPDAAAQLAAFSAAD